MQEQEEAFSWSKLQCEQPCHLAHSSAEPRPPWIHGRRGCSLGSGTTLMGKAQFLGFYELKSPMFFTKYYLEKYSCLRLCSGWHLICVSVQTGRCPGLCIIYSLWGVKQDSHTSTHLHQMEKVCAGLDPRSSWSMRKSHEQMSHIHSMTSLGINHPSTSINPHVWSHGESLMTRATIIYHINKDTFELKNRPGQKAWNETILVKWFCIVTLP